MKRLLLSTIGLLPLLCTAQTNQGRYFFSGNAGFIRQTTKVDLPIGRLATFRNLNGSLAFRRGVFIRDNVALGGNVGFGYGWASLLSNDNRSRTVTPEVGVFMRRYFGQQQWRFFVGGGLGASAEFSRIPQQSGAILTDVRRRNLTFFPTTELGLVYFLTDRWGVELTSRARGLPFQVNSFSVGLIRTGSVKGYTPDQIFPNESTNAAQTQQGNWVLAGTVGFSTNASDRRNSFGRQTSEDKQWEYAVAPSIGWFIQNNTLLGVSVGFSQASSGNTQAGQTINDRRTISLETGPFVRRYIGSYRLRPFVGGTATFRHLRTTFDGLRPTDRRTDRIFTLGASAGLAYLLGERFLVETTLADAIYQLSNGSGDQRETHTLQAGVGMRPSFTVSYVLR